MGNSNAPHGHPAVRLILDSGCNHEPESRQAICRQTIKNKTFLPVPATEFAQDQTAPST